MARTGCSHDRSAWALRAAVAANIVAGLCLIIFGGTIHTPFTAPGVCMVLLGLFNWATALAGLLGSTRFACCLDVFLVLHSVDAVLSLAMVAKLWADFEGVAAAVDPSGGSSLGDARVRQGLRAAQWLLPMFLAVQLGALGLALVMRFLLKPEGDAPAGAGFSDADAAERMASVAHLRVDVEGARINTAGNSKYAKLMAKMAKYNDAARIKFKPRSWLPWA